MAVPTSSLAIAADGIADALQGFFAAASNDVLVTVDTPQAAAEKAKGANSNHFVNLFFYRLAHSGYHSDLTRNEPLFVRLQCLVTPFAGKFDNTANAEPHIDLRILGETIRFFHDQQLSAAPFQNPGADGTAYKLECTLLAPNMEEINHIWTTQGSELAYRLSAVYEFALVPIEPVTRVEPAPPVQVATLDLKPNAVVPGPAAFGPDLRAVAAGGNDGAPLADTWLPIIMLKQGAQLSNALSVATTATAVDVALAGMPGGLAALELNFEKPDGTPIGTTTRRFRTIVAAVLDDPDALTNLTFTRPSGAKRLIIRSRRGEVTANGGQRADANSPYGHALSITFGGTP